MAGGTPGVAPGMPFCEILIMSRSSRRRRASAAASGSADPRSQDAIFLRGFMAKAYPRRSGSRSRLDVGFLRLRLVLVAAQNP
jgi:hypothetical protein